MRSSLAELNVLFGSHYTLTDVWTKRTTLYNQYGYFRNHLSLFEDFIEIKNQNILLKKKCICFIKYLL